MTQPEPELTEKEKDEVKKVAKDMLAKLKAEKLVLPSSTVKRVSYCFI